MGLCRFTHTFICTKRKKNRVFDSLARDFVRQKNSLPTTARAGTTYIYHVTKDTNSFIHLVCIEPKTSVIPSETHDTYSSKFNLIGFPRFLCG